MAQWREVSSSDLYDEAGGVLRATTYGDEYVIEPDGTVSGDGGIQGRVEMLVSRHL